MRRTLRTHELPATAGIVNATIHAHSDHAAFRRLIGRFMAFHAERLATPEWSDIVNLGRNNRLKISMSCLGLDQTQAEIIWQPFFAWVAAAGDDFAREAIVSRIGPEDREFADSPLEQRRFELSVPP